MLMGVSGGMSDVDALMRRLIWLHALMVHIQTDLPSGQALRVSEACSGPFLSLPEFEV